MYDPMYDMIIERQRQIRQELDIEKSLAVFRSTNPGVRQRLVYNLGGLLISLGTRLRESAPEPCEPPVPAVSYRMPEGCQ